MKGHVKLELRNANGETKVVHQDNLITNAVPMFIANRITAGNQISTSDTYPYSVNLSHSLGGVILFANTLVEDKNNIKFPFDNPVLGFGSDVNNSSNPILGTFVASESGKVENGFNFVWDFSSTQANGTIKAIALTNASYTKEQQLIANDYLYYLKNDTYTNGSEYYSFSKTKVISIDEHGSFYIFYKESNKTTIRKITIGLNGTLRASIKDVSETINVFDYSVNDMFDGFDGYAYSAIISNKNANIKRYKLSDFTFEEDTGFSINFFDSRFSYSSDVFYYNCVIYNGCIYIFTYGENYIMVFDLSTGEQKDDITIPFSGLRSILRFSDTKILMFSSNGTYEFDLFNKVIEKSSIDSSTGINSNFRPSYSVNKYNIGFVANVNNSYMCIYSVCNYLGTICNLKTPIEKTADQTLRVTYTLTDINT